MNRLLIVAAGGILAVGGGMAAIPRLSSRGDERVLTHVIRRGDLTVSVNEEGALESSKNREIRCKVKGGSTVLSVIERGTLVEPGDELIRLDTSTIEDNISLQRITYETALSNKSTAASDVAVATIAIQEYAEGTFRSEMATKEKELVVAESNLKASIDARDHAVRLYGRGYVSKLELESKEDAVKHAELEVRSKKIDLEVLEKFTKAKTLQELNGTLAVAKALLGATTATLELEEARLKREEEQLDNCVILAEDAGMVIYPEAEEWKNEPEIEEGAAVREDQILLLMPDLSNMQVKVGIHESKIDQIKPGMEARVTVNGRIISGEVVEIANTTEPAGWWNGNVVKYDTTIQLEEQAGLKPGMKVAVEIFLARHYDVTKIPVAAVVELEGEFLCWVMAKGRYEQRTVQLGDSDDQFVIVTSGLAEGDQIALNPLDFFEDAQASALNPQPADEEGAAKLGENQKEKAPKKEVPPKPVSAESNVESASGDAQASSKEK